MTRTEQQSIERLFSDFAFCADHGDAPGLARLFVEDGVLSVGGRASVGRAQIISDCQACFDIVDRKTRHIWSNLRITDLTGDTASATALQLTFEVPGNDMPVRLRINDVLDELRKDASGAWQFAHRQIRCEMAVTF